MGFVQNNLINFTRIVSQQNPYLNHDKNKKNKLVIFGTVNPYLNTQIIQINPGPELLIK